MALLFEERDAVERAVRVSLAIGSAAIIAHARDEPEVHHDLAVAGADVEEGRVRPEVPQQPPVVLWAQVVQRELAEASLKAYEAALGSGRTITTEIVGECADSRRPSLACAAASARRGKHDGTRRGCC